MKAFLDEELGDDDLFDDSFGSNIQSHVSNRSGKFQQQQQHAKQHLHSQHPVNPNIQSYSNGNVSGNADSFNRSPYDKSVFSNGNRFEVERRESTNHAEWRSQGNGGDSYTQYDNNTLHAHSAYSEKDENDPYHNGQYPQDSHSNGYYGDNANLGNDGDNRSSSQLKVLYAARGRKIESLQKELEEKDEEMSKENRILQHKLTLCTGKNPFCQSSFSDT